MPLEVIYFTPHGLQIIPELEQPYNEDFRPLHDAMMTLSKDIVTKKIDFLILISPHSLSLEDQFGIVLNEKLQGDLPFLTDSNIKSTYLGEKIFRPLQFKGAPLEARSIRFFLKNEGINISSLIFGVKSFAFPLAWAELLPLYYLETLNCLKIPIIVISIPQSRFKLKNFKPNLQKLARKLTEFMDLCSNHFGLILSSDLAHVHDIGGPYGFHSNGKLFDDAVCKYFEKLDSLLLHHAIEKYADTAVACGSSNLIILDEILQNQKTNQNQTIIHSKWQSNMIHYAAPTYFGMAVCKFKKNVQY